MVPMISAVATEFSKTLKSEPNPNPSSVVRPNSICSTNLSPPIRITCSDVDEPSEKESELSSESPLLTVVPITRGNGNDLGRLSAKVTIISRSTDSALVPKSVSPLLYSNTPNTNGSPSSAANEPDSKPNWLGTNELDLSFPQPNTAVPTPVTNRCDPDGLTNRPSTCPVNEAAVIPCPTHPKPKRSEMIEYPPVNRLTNRFISLIHSFIRWEN